MVAPLCENVNNNPHPTNHSHDRWDEQYTWRFGALFSFDKYYLKHRLSAILRVVWWFGVFFDGAFHQPGFCPQKAGFENPKAFFFGSSDAPGCGSRFYLMK